MTVSGLTKTKADRQSLQTRAQPSPQEAIGGGQFRPIHRATQDAELVPKREILQLKSSSRSEGCRRGGGNYVKSAER